jgi:hypothetical protein
VNRSGSMKIDSRIAHELIIYQCIRVCVCVCVDRGADGRHTPGHAGLLLEPLH